MVESIITSAVVAALVSGVISILIAVLNNKHATISVRESRRYENAVDLYREFQDNIESIQSRVRKERDSAIYPVDLDVAAVMISSYKQIVLLLHEVYSVIERSSYFLDKKTSEELREKYILLNNEIRRNPDVSWGYTDFNELTESADNERLFDINIKFESIIKAKEYLNDVLRLVREVKSTIENELRTLTRS